MSKFRTCFLGLLLLTGLLSEPLMGGAELGMRAGIQDPIMRVYFTPFEATTYVPLTMDDIEQRSSYIIWFLKEHPSVRETEHPFVSNLRHLLRSRPGRAPIDNLFIRLKVVLGKEVFFVDQKGRVLDKNNDRTFTLSRPQRREIEREIRHFSGIVDIRGSQSTGLIK